MNGMRVFAALLLCLGASAWRGASADAGEGGSMNAVVAEVGDRVVTERDLYEDMVKENGEKALDRIVSHMLVRDELERLDMAVTDEEIDAVYAEKEAEYRRNAGSDASLAKDLRDRYGVSAEEYRQKVIWFDLALEKLIRAEIKPTDADLFNFYFPRRARYNEPEKIEVSHILVDPRRAGGAGSVHRIPSEKDWERAHARALDLSDRLRDGADFADLARKHSHDEATAKDGGELGYLTRTSQVFRVLRDAAFAIEDGETTDPVKTVMGYHIVLRRRTIPAREPGFEELKPRIRKDFESYVASRGAVRYLGLLKQRAVEDGRLRIRFTY